MNIRKTVLALVVGIGLVNHCSAQSDVCPRNFVQYSGNHNCYGFVGSQITWASAQAYCSEMRGHLVKITDAGLQRFLVSEISTRYNEAEITIITKPEYNYTYLIDYGIDIRGQTSISFEVMACNDVHIALSKEDGLDEQDTYEIVIGGWGATQSVIRDCKQCEHMDTYVHQQPPIDCYKSNPFWISWKNNVIRVGKGSDVGKQQFLFWHDPSPHEVNYVAFSTWPYVIGDWKVKKGTYEPGLFWIGASDQDKVGQWVWLPSHANISYSNWAPPELDNSDNHCAVIDIQAGYQWGDDNCEAKRNFICETVIKQNSGPVIFG